MFYKKKIYFFGDIVRVISLLGYTSKVFHLRTSEHLPCITGHPSKVFHLTLTDKKKGRRISHLFT